jgi:hypothetical protein
MRRTLYTLATLALLAVPCTASAHDMHQHGAAPSKTAGITLVGEVVDAGCYLGHAARGADHKDCAKQCILGGMPMGLVTSDGTVYLLTRNHDNPDPYDKLKGMAGKMVSITGVQMSRGGMKGLDVAGVREMATKASSQPARAS